jgi:transcription-repair coupling factor (superfamily II helicase)
MPIESTINQLPFNLEFKPGFHHYFDKTYGSALALSIAKTAISFNRLNLVFLPNARNLNRLKQEIEFFLGKDSDIPVFTLPDWETLPYDYFSPHQDIISERLETLYRLPRQTKGILLLPINSALQRLPHTSFIEQQCLLLEKGQIIDVNELRLKLNENGYLSVSTVMDHGEYAVRGSIIDLFPMGAKSPIRIELFDIEIESLRYFDSESQLTTEKVDSINLLPAKEYPTSEQGISHFRQAWRSTFDTNIKENPIYRDVSKGIFPAGIEYYLPLFFEETSSLFDYLSPEKSLFIFPQTSDEPIDQFWTELTSRHEQNRYDVERPILTPNELYLSKENFNHNKKRFPQIIFLNNKTKSEQDGHAPIGISHFALPNLLIDHKNKEPLLRLKQIIDSQQNTSQNILICAESKGRQEVIRELLLKLHIESVSINSWHEFILLNQTNTSNKPSIHLISMPLGHGFSLENALIIAESDLFGSQVLVDKRRNNKAISPDQLIHSLAELKIGDPVVHIEQGVGRYKGLETIETSGITTEFLTLEYAGGSKLYVPVQSLELIHRFSGTNPETAPLHKLGSEAWAKAKQKAIEKARDTAAELLDIYARRGAEIGFKHKINEFDYNKFAQEFPYPLTEDQSTSIDNVLKDMKSSQPMDRLICGDVGFGKTEVAMRAAFVCLQSGMQVAMLVPTTLLAQQHHNSFLDRFSEWPINIAVLSRFQTKKEQTETLIKLESGQVDLVIGTHRLISGNLKFKNLGLLVIDEEHRFGVRQKEILKSYRAKVDILTLTATPIPRTLNMSMSGMRDLSIIATPPAKRLAIKTFVRQRNEPLIKEAIQREISRGGQIFFLHNSVDTIDRTAKEISELVPNIEVAVAHGQMPERQLENIMSDFQHHRYHVLVSTTIIETGIDIPNANTIIMDRADKLGLAQLHQLRGRVGRSHHQAYAYLLTPNPKMITKDATKRLEAIGKLEDLGAGFILATHDLEIRGAGEFLGDEQTGHMQTIGFSLYMELLERAIKSLKSGDEGSLTDVKSEQTEVNLGISALLPDDYIGDVSVRLSLYKRIANAKDSRDLRSLQVELIDRFGLLPNPTKCLFKVSELKLKLTPMGVTKLHSSEAGWTLDFNTNPLISTDKLIQLIQSNPARYRLSKGTQFKITQSAQNLDERLQQIESLIEKLAV